MIGCNTIIALMATEHGSAVNSAIGGRYIHPDCGSAAKGAPLIE